LSFCFWGFFDISIFGLQMMQTNLGWFFIFFGRRTRRTLSPDIVAGLLKRPK
jgi:hypothetical protein